VRTEIDRVRSQIERDQMERDRLAKELHGAETAVGEAREGLEQLRRERTERTDRRSALAGERHERERELAAERDALAREVRAAYAIGREEPLKLLLSQRDPERTSRMLAYYGYFGRARAERIGRIESKVQQIVMLDEQLETEQRRIAELEEARKAEVEKLERARARRGQVLANLQAESASRQQSLERLRQQQTGLEKLVRELARAMEKFPVDAKDAFARLRGKLAWPVTGQLAARFGESRGGGVRWNGVLITAERGAPVRAIYHGRVIYADWLPGLGLLAIVDHGDGYISLYGHNDKLYKAAGERVTAGDTIAAVGDTGGRSRPELYFEVRRSGRPVDPRPWFRSALPSN